MKRSITWVLMHLLLIVIVITNLLTGFRIASVHRPHLLSLSPIFPQGSLHDIHFISALLLCCLTILYFAYLFVMKNKVEVPQKFKQSCYHKCITWLGYISLSLIILSGISLYFQIIPSNIALTVHFYIAILLFIYLPIHAGIYFIQYGINVFNTIFVGSLKNKKRHSVFLCAFVLVTVAAFYTFDSKSPIPLTVHAIKLGDKISIDGIANEHFWQNIPEQKVTTFGGANFTNGSTEVRIKAVENSLEAFFNISWDDPDKSIKHLPLVKTKDGWKVTEDGFYTFDEQSHYEDKFAVILSDNCDFGAAGTAHLGPKPLKDKPANWHGKGYHYSQNESIVDLWHWKAVRTNDMYLMDDNYISAPVKAKAGARRYTAGYQTDAKTSGAYVMNWRWYTPNTIIPKRLFSAIDDNDIYQQDAAKSKQDDASWVIPWYDAVPYQAEVDNFPIGTVLPSVLHRSNRLEGDRADVRAFGQWHDGKWNIELSRKLSTKSDYDVPLTEGICLWVAAFDKSQVAHTRHARPLQLTFSRGAKQ